MVKVSLAIEVNTAGQLVTKRAGDLLESEFANLQAVVRGERVDPKSIDSKVRSAVVQYLTALAVIAGIVIIGAVVAYMLLGHTGALFSGGSVGLFIGCMIAWFWLDIDLKKNQDALKRLIPSTLVIFLIIGVQYLTTVFQDANRVPGTPRNRYEEFLIQDGQTSLIVALVAFAFVFWAAAILVSSRFEKK
jgi:mannose/fructose/N-acetylgalactosamine-specific phosphotransferase system component IID